MISFIRRMEYRLVWSFAIALLLAMPVLIARAM
jgi:hypothetical protein